ncbi:rubrerythrin family protein [Thermococcus argininiproducens]|uniref:Rubrerythrin family protein n=1 Tax=Thermococcus argininiproducens TaxID=2866384 RepID=A0A9E7MAZ1_9EURY|nr:ferritin family protein [Thermococcus argininiproducens]USH00304.1 rubrerythrin family protein [Thermococcus argininiproducens]
MVEPLVKKAADVENEAAKSYTEGLAKLRGQGLKYTDVEAVVSRIAVDTIVHKHLMKAILEAQKELEKVRKGYEQVKEPMEMEMSKEQALLVKRFAEMHLEIEKDMIETYQKMAEKMTHPLFKGLAEALVKNEEEHHRLLKQLIEKHKE